MRTWLSFHFSILSILFMARFAEEMSAAGGEEKKGLPTWAIVLIVVAVVVLCVLPICVIVALALAGPAVGNVFSNVIEELEAGSY